MNRDLSKITRLCVMDFDGTLVNTPLPDTGRKEYQDKTGNPWPHEGWWGKAESLNMEVFDMPTNASVISDYEQEKSNEQTGLILLTGRMVKLQDSVKAILNAKDLTFHEYHFNRGGSTDAAKIKTLNALLDKYPNVTSIAMWEDRLAHVEIFEQWGREQCVSGRLADFSVTVVVAPDRDGLH